MEDYTLTINNKRLYQFYKNNPNINIESLNLLILNFIEEINNDLTKTIQNTITQEILNNVKEIKNDIQNNHSNIILKFHDINKEYNENMKLLISTNSNTSNERFQRSLEKTTENFIHKINEILPTNNSVLNNTITEQIDKLKQFTFENIKKIENQDTLKEFLTTMDFKIQNIQQPVLSYISANNENLTNKLNNLKETNITSQTKQDKIMDELGDFLNKYKASSTLKGQFSENRIETLLHQTFKDAEIVNTSALKASGDFMIKRYGLPNILIENKNYKTNVNVDEIRKFLRDVNEQKCNGIFMSQHSGIVGKSDYFIEIHDGCILIYLHDVDYASEKIKTAVNIIDNIYPKLQQISNTNKSGFVIKKEIMDFINNEHQIFLNQKDSIITLNKEYTKKLQTMVEDLKLPTLQTLLCENYASIQNQEWECDICGECFTKKSSLASHRKVHKDKILLLTNETNESNTKVNTEKSSEIPVLKMNPNYEITETVVSKKKTSKKS